ncbi:MAG: Lrp/AsnC family transcriptional regulator [Neptuniibacter sp.]|jgi:Lrp/AsnC family leucine-responsive transcriptional regulator|uniref:Lrp/AsnC family transcriptional regulator n=1 Tax=Neptuniibacter sp. TaxID=1962643 RepID=UPI003B5B9A20
MDKLDKLDMAILRELQKSGRITVTELASIVGLSKTPCQVRVKRLEELNYIQGYTAIIDQKKLGSRHVAFVQVTMSDTKTKALQAFNDAIREIPEVEQCHMIAGNFDYLVKVRTSDIDSYREVLGEKISSLPNVKQTSTFVVMEDVKDVASRVI